MLHPPLHNKNRVSSTSKQYKKPRALWSSPATVTVDSQALQGRTRGQGCYILHLAATQGSTAAMQYKIQRDWDQQNLHIFWSSVAEGSWTKSGHLPWSLKRSREKKRKRKDWKGQEIKSVIMAPVSSPSTDGPSVTTANKLKQLHAQAFFMCTEGCLGLMEKDRLKRDKSSVPIA